MRKIKGTTSTGFQFTIDEEARDDYDLLVALGELDDNPNKPWYIDRVANMLLGKDGFEKLRDHCRGESGRVIATKVAEEITNIFDAIKAGESDTKNS